MKKKVLMSWSCGKDCAWALHKLRQDPHIEVVGLFSTVNAEFQRVSMHGVRIELLRRQAESLGLELELIEIPYPCSNEDYEAVMRHFVDRAKDRQIDAFAFGDLFLEDVRRYREEKLRGSGIEVLFPLWGVPTGELLREMLDGGLRTLISCVDSRQLAGTFAGREIDRQFPALLPESVDPCGENGEFHTFVFDGPMFRYPLKVVTGEIADREGFIFADILPAE